MQNLCSDGRVCEGLTNAQRMRYNITATSEFRVAGVGGACVVSNPHAFFSNGCQGLTFLSAVRYNKRHGNNERDYWAY